MELVTYLCVLTSIITVHVTSAEPFIEQPPDRLTTTQGDTITIRCGIGSHITATLSWQNMVTGDIITQGSVVDPELNFPLDMRERYNITGNTDIGEYNLQIRDVTRSDEGQYSCYYYDEAAQTEQQSNIVTLIVMIPPAKGYPLCTMEPYFNQPGDTVTITCESRGGNPPAALTWIREQDILDVKYAPNKEVSHSRISVFLTEDDVDVRYICIARNPATKEPPSCSLKPIRTSLEVEIEPPTTEVRPGKSAVFNCVTEDLPNLQYFWYVNTHPVEDDQDKFTIKRKGKRLIVHSVDLSDDLMLVTCVVDHHGPNNVITASASAILRVDQRIYPESTPLPSIDIGFTSDASNNIDITTQSITTTESIKTTSSPIQRTTTAIDIETTTERSKTDLSVSERPHRDARCRGDTCDDGSTSVKPMATTNLVTDDNKITHGETTVNSKNNILSTKKIFKTIATKAPNPSHEESNIISNPPTRPSANPSPSLNGNQNRLCRDGACAAVASGNRTQVITINPSTDKSGVSMVTPPHEKGVNPNANDPVGQRDFSMTLMLILASICLIAIIIVIVLMIWKKRRSSNQKAEDKENQSPVANGRQPPKSPAQGRSGLKNQNKYSKTCTSYSSIF